MEDLLYVAAHGYGLRVFDVSDPATPSLLGSLSTGFVDAFDVEVVGGEGSGCANGIFTSGAKLVGSGEASVSSDTLVLSTSGTEPNNTRLYFQGNNRTAGGDGNVFGDGLRCAGGGLIRLQIRTSDAAGESQTTIGITAKGLVSPGDTRRYQCWYRTILSPPCGAGAYDSNLSNGYQVVWTPWTDRLLAKSSP